MNNNKIYVGIASMSDAKIEGIKNAFQHFFENSEIIVYPRKTSSGVSKQPFGEETSKGAINRLTNLYNILKDEQLSIDYYISCEAGIDNKSIPGEYFSEQLVCLLSKETKKTFFSKSSSWSIPKEDIKEIEETSLDSYLIKRGCIGLQDIGNGKYITRATAVEEGVKAALASEMNYKKTKELLLNKKENKDMEI